MGAFSKLRVAFELCHGYSLSSFTRRRHFPSEPAKEDYFILSSLSSYLFRILSSNFGRYGKQKIYCDTKIAIKARTEAERE